MPTFSHGKATKIQIDNAAGTLMDISNVSNSVEMPRPVDTAETSTFGTNSKTYVVGMNDSTVSIAGLFDATVDAQIALVLDGQADGTIVSSTVEYGPQGGTTGKVKYTCEVIWTSYSVSTGTGDVASFSLEGQRTGSTTRAVYP